MHLYCKERTKNIFEGITFLSAAQCMLYGLIPFNNHWSTLTFHIYYIEEQEKDKLLLSSFYKWGISLNIYLNFWGNVIPH